MRRNPPKRLPKQRRLRMLPRWHLQLGRQGMRRQLKHLARKRPLRLQKQLTKEAWLQKKCSRKSLQKAGEALSWSRHKTSFRRKAEEGYLRRSENPPASAVGSVKSTPGLVVGIALPVVVFFVGFFVGKDG